jgi:2-amino-4-hydroxy-6-hydroxymethyldihydropteridine diphosphokinase
MNKVYLLLGSNIGDSYTQIELAAREVNISTGKLLRRSSLYATAAWGNRNQPDFLNQLLVIESYLIRR